MALPKLDTAPKYELTVPSTGEKIRYRPFLVKEQKILLIAYESQDKKQIVNAMLDACNTCIQDDVDVYNLAIFDIDYIFTQIRAKSVGENVPLEVTCSNCQIGNEVVINLENIKIKQEKVSNIIQLTHSIKLIMKFPTYQTFLNNQELLNNNSGTELIMELIVASLDTIQTEEENIIIKDESREDIIDFIDSMTGSQFEMISKYIESMPQMRYDIKFKCKACNTDNEHTLQGIDDFF